MTNLSGITVRSGLVWTVILIALALLVLASCGTNSRSGVGPGGNKVTSALPGPAVQAHGSRYIVVLKPGATAADAANLSGTLSQRPDQSYQTVFKGFAGPLTAAELAALKANLNVAYIESDVMLHIVAKPPPPPQMYTWGYLRIHAGLNTGNGGSGVCVAVIDTGIDTDHPDLENAVVAQYNATVFQAQKKKFAEDDNGHGTYVSGIIASRNNTIGVVGVAPLCSLAAVKVMDMNGNGQISWVIAGIDWVAANASQYNIKVANMSLVGEGYNQALYDAIDATTNLGVTFVAGAGNNFEDAAGYQPAAFDNVICVSALNLNDIFASFSNYGSVIDLIAPGATIYSLWKGGGYMMASGTSASCPFVAGSAALWLDDHYGGFNEVYAELTGTGEAAPQGGWPGDPDGIPEPLVDATTL